ncbi:NfeD family protein [Treponema phagedenis]|nr:NfeD family protein [Treponema phagedenis]
MLLCIIFFDFGQVLMEWYIWLIIGIACIGLELVIPGLVIIFFGFGAVGVGLLTFIPFVDHYLWVQIFLFIIFSFSSLFFLRKRFTGVFTGTVFGEDIKKDAANEFAEVIEEITPHKEGRIKYAGTTWNARSLSEELIPPGTSVRVLRREGMAYVVDV